MNYDLRNRDLPAILTEAAVVADETMPTASIVAHEQNHVVQATRVMASPGFPARP
jgi:hypothetical protein